MAAKLTRRHLASLAAVPLLAQSTPAQTQSASPEDDLAIQRENLKRWREQARSVKLPIATEPAFTFRP